MLRDNAKALGILKEISGKFSLSTPLILAEGAKISCSLNNFTGYHKLLRGEHESAREQFKHARLLFPSELKFMKKVCSYWEGLSYYFTLDWANVLLLFFPVVTL